jgi:hypothetical protein
MFRAMQVQEGPMPCSVVQLSILMPLSLARIGDMPATDGPLAPGTRTGRLEDGTPYTITVQSRTSYGGVSCVGATMATAAVDRFETCLTATGYGPYVFIDTADSHLTVELLAYSRED